MGTSVFDHCETKLSSLLLAFLRCPKTCYPVAEGLNSLEPSLNCSCFQKYVMHQDDPSRANQLGRKLEFGPHLIFGVEGVEQCGIKGFFLPLGSCQSF